MRRASRIHDAASRARARPGRAELAPSQELAAARRRTTSVRDEHAQQQQRCRSRRPIARWWKLVRKSAFCSPAKTAIASTTPMIVPRPPKIETPPSSTIVDDAQLEAEPVVLHRGREAERVEDPGQRADDAGDDEQEQLRALDPDAREARRLLVRADRRRATGRTAWRAGRPPKTTASTMKIADGVGEVAAACAAAGRRRSSCISPGSSRSCSGRGSTTAMPRYSVSVPIVTASDGSPSRVTRNPLNAPGDARRASTVDDHERHRPAVAAEVADERARHARGSTRPRGRSRR